MMKIQPRRIAALVSVWLFAVLLAMPYADAQSQWTTLANLPDGTWSIAPDPTNGNSMYALNTDGVSHTTDAGAAWAVCSPGAVSMSLAGPARGQAGAPLLYAAGPIGLRVSSDGCKTWRDVPGQGIAPSSAHVHWLASYPNNVAVLYAGMDGLGGLYRSTDAGATWQAASKGLPTNAWATALTSDPTVPSTVFIGLHYTSNNHSPALVYKSTDGGLTWRSSSLGLHVLPNNGGRIVGLGWSGPTLFATTSDDGLYRSADRGATWTPATMPRRTNQPSNTPAPLKIGAMYADPDGALLLSTQEGAFLSLDGGGTWQAFGPDNARGKPALLNLDPGSGRVVMSSGGQAWSYKLPSGLVSLPQPTSPANTQMPATPPPPVPAATFTPTPTATATTRPTSTPRPTATPSPTVVLVTGPKPSDPARPLDPSVSDYFKETGHNLGHVFRDYWQANGGLARFGLPLTEEFVESGVPVQYFERARFEYRDGQVGLGRLGAELTQDFAGPAFRPIPFFASQDNNIYFGPTKHSVSGPFLDFFRANGRLESVGYPLSESYKPDENSEVQWFERARFEWHRALPEGKRIVLGNIGTEALQKRGWIR